MLSYKIFVVKIFYFRDSFSMKMPKRVIKIHNKLAFRSIIMGFRTPFSLILCHFRRSIHKHSTSTILIYYLNIPFIMCELGKKNCKDTINLLEKEKMLLTNQLKLNNKGYNNNT